MRNPGSLWRFAGRVCGVNKELQAEINGSGTRHDNIFLRYHLKHLMDQIERLHGEISNN